MAAQVGRPFFVACSADGSPAPKIEWTKLDESGKKLHSVGSELRFDSIEQSDSGPYECRASNGVEHDLATRIQLEVLGK